MRASIIVFPGSNRERDVARVLRAHSAATVDFVWHGDTTVPAATDLIVLPGGFSFGDYLRTGAMAAHSPIMRDVAARARAGVAVLGICNGFQILCEAGLLPGVLMRNASLRFACRDVWLRVETSETMFTRAYNRSSVQKVIVAHGDGNYFADTDTLDRLEGEGRVAFRYAEPDGAITAAANPNGSQRNIAGITDATGRILGLMPHPENACEPLLGSTDGRGLFEGLRDVGLVGA